MEPACRTWTLAADTALYSNLDLECSELMRSSSLACALPLQGHASLLCLDCTLHTLASVCTSSLAVVNGDGNPDYVRK